LRQERAAAESSLKGRRGIGAEEKSVAEDTDRVDAAARSTQGPAKNPPAESRLGFVGRLRNWLVTGLLVTAPIVVSLYVTWIVIHFVDSTVTPFVPARYLPESYLPFRIPGTGLVIVLVALILIGALTASLLGRYLLHLSDHLLARMPVVRGIYGATKQIFETVLSSQGNAFRSVVLIEYPRKGIWTLGFISGTTRGEVADVTDETLVNVFVPTTPNPTSGFLLFLPKKDVMELSMTVEEGIKMIISGGIVTPPDRRPKPVPELPFPTVQEKKLTGS
jgi:uncharacterized membrane protein